MTRRAALFWCLSGCMAVGLLGLMGCESVPKGDIGKFVEVVPASAKVSERSRKPFVLFLQGTGGGNARAEIWTGWFNTLGVTSVIVDSARLRGQNNLEGVDSYHQSSDVSMALEYLQSRTDLDFRRYAIMGFSRGATAALQAGSTLRSGQPQPQFVFSMYPGGAGQCPNTYSDTTRVLVFYGELDASGTRNGNRDRCRSMIEGSKNAAYHGFPDTHHAYDAMVSAVAHDGAGSYLIKHNQKAVDETRRLILSELRFKWLDALVSK